jgi:UDP:flavonoid glycosyltransferase YjiC (YdhE family)
VSRIVVCSAAYLGDVAPYIPVADELARRGHDVTFLAPEGYRSILDDPGHGFTYAPYALDFSASAMHADPRHERLMRHPYRNSAQLGRYWMGLGFADDPDAGRRSLAGAFDGADAVVSHPTFGSASIPVAHSMGIPVAVGHLFPMMIPTRRWGPPLGPKNYDLGPLNRAAWTAMLRGSGPLFRDREMNQLRTGLGLPAVRGVAGWSWQEAERTVVLLSEHYFGEVPDDWPPVTWGGFSWWDGPPLQPEVEAFLDDDDGAGDNDGDRPVLVTLGTSAASGAGAAFARIAADLDAAGIRSLLLVGDERNLPPLGGRPGAFRFASVARALPRCRAAVISGALGGLAAALRAGVPIVVLPQLFDQIWHGRRVEDLGLGVMVRKPEQVGPAILRLLDDPSQAERSGAFAAKLADEDGAAALADAAEALA